MRRARRVLTLLALGFITQIPAERAAPPLAMPSGSTVPRGDSDCARFARRSDGRERQVANTTANRTMPSGRVRWSMEPEIVRWRRWMRKRAQITGHFTGTTDQIFRWAACKWNLDVDLLRAVAIQEST
jgi:hypothetical protein